MSALAESQTYMVTDIKKARDVRQNVYGLIEVGRTNEQELLFVP